MLHVKGDVPFFACVRQTEVSDVRCPPDVTVWKEQKYRNPSTSLMSWSFHKKSFHKVYYVYFQIENGLPHSCGNCLFSYHLLVEVHDNGSETIKSDGCIIFIHIKKIKKGFGIVHSTPNHCKGIFIWVSCVLRFLHGLVSQSRMSSPL